MDYFAAALYSSSKLCSHSYQHGMFLKTIQRSHSAKLRCIKTAARCTTAGSQQLDYETSKCVFFLLKCLLQRECSSKRVFLVKGMIACFSSTG